MDKMKMKEAENIKDGKIEGIPKVGSDRKEASLKSQTSSLSTEQDLDSFLLGDLENSDVEAGKIGTLLRQVYYNPVLCIYIENRNTWQELSELPLFCCFTTIDC